MDRLASQSQSPVLSCTGDVASPMFFGATGCELFGWFHAPNQQSACGFGLVICGSLGAEDVAAQLTLRFLAGAAATAGIPTLRFDYQGCGHSTGSDDEPERVEKWLSSVHCAIDSLKHEARVERVALLGVRAGALFAASAAASRNDVDCLVAIAPPNNGRALLREWKVLAQARADARRRPMSGADGELEAGGFWFSRETCEAFAKLDLMQLDRCPAAQVLVVDRDDMPVSNRWAKHLQSQGAQVHSLALVGYSRMVEEPQRAQVPAESVHEIVRWLLHGTIAVNCSESSAAPRLGSPSMGRQSAIVLHSSVPGGSPVVECAVQISADGAELFGVVSSPLTAPPVADREQARKGILLLAHGATRCLGPGRMYVPLARRWAALGYVVLRLDLSGIGDSSTRPEQTDHVIYGPYAARDVAIAIEYMRSELGVQNCEAIGICSGAYHSFKAAVAGQGLGSVIAVNPAVFFWHEGMSLDVLPEEMVTVRSIAGYRRSLRSVTRWRKWLRGEANVSRAMSMVARRLAMRVKRHLRDAARWAGIAVSDDLAGELRSVALNGTELQFVFSPGEAGLVLLREQAGSCLERLRRCGEISISTIEEADHNFSSKDSRIRLSAMLESMVNRKRKGNDE